MNNGVTSMFLLIEPIAISISVAALIMSLLALLLSRRKYLTDQRLELSKQIADIKNEYAEILIVLDQMLDLLKETVPTYKPDILLKFKSEVEDLYTKLGKQDPITNDPVTLSSVAIDSKLMKDRISQLLHSIDKIVHKEPATKKRKSHRPKARK